MDRQHIVNINDRCWCDVGDRLLGFTQSTQSNFCRIWVAIVEDSRNKISSVTVDTLDDHHPQIGPAGDDVDLLWSKRVVTHIAALDSIKNNVFDLLF